MKTNLNYSPEFEAALRKYLSYDPKTGILKWIKTRSNKQAGTIAGSDDFKGSLQLGFMGRKMRAHRICWFLHYGTWPLEIDHWDTNGTNNAIRNLRDISHQTNCENHRRANSNNSTGLLGVHRNNNSYAKPFKAVIKVNGEIIHLGHFDTAEEAHFAYIEAKRKVHRGNTL